MATYKNTVPIPASSTRPDVQVTPTRLTKVGLAGVRSRIAEEAGLSQDQIPECVELPLGCAIEVCESLENKRSASSSGSHPAELEAKSTNLALVQAVLMQQRVRSDC